MRISSKFTDARYKNIKELFDLMKMFFINCEKSFNAALNNIYFRQEILKRNLTDAGLFRKTGRKLSDFYEQSKIDVEKIIKKLWKSCAAGKTLDNEKDVDNEKDCIMRKFQFTF